MKDDLIKRSDAINVVAFYAGQRFATIILNKVPAVDRPQGEWIVSCDDSICPICGKDEAEFIYGTEIWYGQGKSHYCPNCGARMKGVTSEQPNN